MEVNLFIFNFSMKKLISKLCVLTGLFLLIDFSIGFGLEFLYHKQNSGNQYKTTMTVDSIRHEIVILGSSRAVHHYVPALIKEHFDLSCYNAGRDGNFFIYSFAMMKAITSRYNPKIIILDINSSEFTSENSRDNSYLSSLNPYYTYHEELRDVIEMKSNFERIKFYSKMYSYNSLIFNILNNLRNRTIDTLNGFIPLGEIKVDTLNARKIPLFHQDLRKSKVDNNKLYLLKNFMEICKRKKIKLIIVESPKLTITELGNLSDSINNLISQFPEVINLNYSNSKYYLDRPFMLSDREHLNFYGANNFTNRLMLDIDSISK